MSVRKGSMKSIPRESSRGWRVFGGVALWIGLLVACFLVGALIISPMLNVASGSRNAGDAAAPQGSTSAANPSPLPQQPAAAPRRDERRRSAEDEPGIRITPDDSASGIQRPQSPDSTDDSRVDARPSRSERRR